MATARVTTSALPGPQPVPLAGRVIQSYKVLRDPLRYLRWTYKTYGSISGIQRGDTSSIFAFGPEYNRLLLSNSTLFYTIFETITPKRSKQRRRGIGLLNMNGEQHKQQRKLMMPAFHRKQVEGYCADMAAYTEALLNRWRPGQQLDMAEEMRELTMRIAVKTLFGLDLAEGVHDVGESLQQLLDAGIFSPAVAFFPLDLPGTPYRRVLKLGERFEQEIMQLIAIKRANPAEQRDILATLIHARDEEGGKMTDTELIGQANTLFIAGHETSSNALTWTLFLLAQHPQHFADVVDELDNVLGGAAPAVEQLGKLTKLEHVIKESMRIIPPAALMSRISTGPFELGPYSFPKDTFITFGQIITHHMPELYAEPARFNPGRWETIDPSPYEYLPFGAGPRMCIGATFAMTEIKLILAMLLQRYRPAVPAGAQIDWQLRVTLAPRATPMIVHAQDRQFRKEPVHGNIHELVDLR